MSYFKHFLTSTAILFLIPYIDRNGLLCSSVSVIDSVNNPTLFCTISGYYCFISHTVITTFLIGAIFHYVLVNFVIWWFFYLCIFFHKVVYPFHANRMEKMGQHKYIFTTVVLLGMYTHYQVCD